MRVKIAGLTGIGASSSGGTGGPRVGGLGAPPVRRHSRAAAIVGCVLLASGAMAEDRRFLNTREIILSYVADAETPVEKANVWISRDAGATWAGKVVEPDRPGSVRFTVSEDGDYDFYLVLINKFGASSEPPTPGSPAHLRVTIDTHGPTLQATEPLLTRVGDQFVFHARAVIVDERLTAQSIRVYYSTPAGWQDGGPAHVSAGLLTWPVPAEARQPLDVQLVVTDQAGNRAAVEFFGLTLPADKPTPKTEPPTLVESTLVADVEVAPARPVAPSPIVNPAAPAETPAASPSTGAVQESKSKPEASQTDAVPLPEMETNYAQAARMREMAARYSERGQVRLARAHLENALDYTPDDPSLLTTLGETLIRVGDLNEAGRRFSEALTHRADYAPAIDGLALVAAMQRQYPVARERLLQLIELTPRAPEAWLRLGDIEHRLGRRNDAVKAWQTAREVAQPSAGSDGAAPLPAAPTASDLKSIIEKAEIRLRQFSPTPGARAGGDGPDAAGSTRARADKVAAPVRDVAPPTARRPDAAPVPR